MMIRFRHGLIIGAALGYYLGAKAGRQRYEQMNVLIDKVRSAPRFAKPREVIAVVVEQGRVQTRDLLDQVTGGAADMILDARPDD